MAAMAVWAGFYLLEIVHPALSVKIIARKMLYFGMAFAPPFWLAFALRYTGMVFWRSRRRHGFLLAAPGAIAFLLGLTNEYHRLVWASVALSSQPVAPLEIEYGIAFRAYTALAYALILAGVLVYASSHARSGRRFRVKTGVVLTGVILTAAVNLFFLYFENGITLDPTPLSFGISAPLIAFGFFRFGTSSLFPLAATAIVENLRDALIVVNHRDEITDINRAAADLLGLASLAEGVSVFSVLPDADLVRAIWDSPDQSAAIKTRGAGTHEARVMPIVNERGDTIGRAIVLRNVTQETILLEAEKRRSKQLSLLEETGRRIADSFDEREILQRTVDAVIQQFGYALTSISVLTAEGELEVAAISGVEDFDYRPGFRQKIGEGIIGHTAELKRTYISKNVSEDPHYFSSSKKSGSAICAPIFKQGNLFGVIYVESFELDSFDDLDVVTLETLASQVSESLQRAELYARTQSDLRALTVIQEISKLAASSLDIETISRAVIKKLKETYRYGHVGLYALREDYLILIAQMGYPESLSIKKIHVSQGVTGRAIRTKSAQFIADTNKEGVFLKTDDTTTSEICVPLIKEGNVLGALNVESDDQNRLTAADLELLGAIAAPIALALDNARLHANLKQMATTDAVTGLFNRHVFEEAIVAEVERAKRSGVPLSLIIFDIDFFKQYNDTWGHPAGDARLKAVADILKASLRKYDIAARYGGDEFAVILAGCDQSSAIQFARRLRAGILQNAPSNMGAGRELAGYTLSMGIATFPQDAALPADLLIAADNAALQAKRKGRDGIQLAGDYNSAGLSSTFSSRP